MFLLLCCCPFLEIIDHYFKTALNTIKYLSFKNHMVKYLESLFAFKWPAGIFLFKVYDTKEKIYYVVVTYWQIALFQILSHGNWNERIILFFVLCNQPSILISTLYQGTFDGLDGRRLCCFSPHMQRERLSSLSKKRDRFIPSFLPIAAFFQ